MSKAAGKATSAPLMGRDSEPTIFSFSRSGRRASAFRKSGIASQDWKNRVPTALQRTKPLQMADVSERDLVAHVTRLSHRQYAVDLGAYPLGSCTMKYNPKVCDETSMFPGFTQAHPAAPAMFVQGWLELLWNLEQTLCSVTGMSAATLQPPAGAAGELTGLLLMRAYHEANGNARSKIIIPDQAHGTNPASVTLGGYEAVTVPSDERGLVNVEALKAVVDEEVAGIMLTNPNTLGLFEENIIEIAQVLHEVGALLYYDGANLNAILGATRPGDMGFDVVHMNLHKTFAVPHGGGGPGAGPVAVSERLAQYLPGPMARPTSSGTFEWHTPEHSIGRVHGWHGNALALVRALTYIWLHGSEGLAEISERAVLNANYMRVQLRDVLDIPYDRTNMHEFVASAKSLKKATGVKALDLAKAMLDEGFHAPTMYFPLIVEEALMIEPTETESRETLDAMVETIASIVQRAEAGEGEVLKAQPMKTPVGRVDEARAARQLIPTDDAPRT